MEWKVEHIIDAVDATIEDVERVVLDPSTTALLPRYMPGIARATVLSRVEDAHSVRTHKRFEPSVTLPAFARGVRPDMTQWVEAVSWDKRSKRATFTVDANVPDEWKRYFSAHGTYRLEARGARTARVIEGELSVRVPLVSALAERYIVGVLREMFAGEARALGAALAIRAAA